MVWVVSATYEAGQTPNTAPPPLQDNGQIIMRMIASGLSKKEVVGLRRLWNVQGALVGCLGTSFFLSEVYGRRHLYSLGCRAVLTLSIARMIRTISFLVTVLPSQNKFCYQQHFPYPPPTNWMEWIWVGFLPSKFGGCNDLIISGHATVTSTLACVSSSVSDDLAFSASLWIMVILDYMVEIFEGFHYSVDMWLGMILVCLLWRVLKPVEGREQSTIIKNSISGVEEMNTDQTTNKPSIDLLPWKVTIFTYSSVAMVSFLQLVVFPSWTVNFLIVLYVVVICVLFLGFALRMKDPVEAALYQHCSQHILYCLLYMALGVYL